RHGLRFGEVRPGREGDVLLRPVCHGDDGAIVQEVDMALVVADGRGGARRDDGAARELEDHVQGGPGDHLTGGRRQDLNRGGGRRPLRLRLRAAATTCRPHDDEHDSKGEKGDQPAYGRGPSKAWWHHGRQCITSALESSDESPSRWRSPPCWVPEGHSPLRPTRPVPNSSRTSTASPRPPRASTTRFCPPAAPLTSRCPCGAPTPSRSGAFRASRSS